jgi:hypothetical protein
VVARSGAVLYGGSDALNIITKRAKARCGGPVLGGWGGGRPATPRKETSASSLTRRPRTDGYRIK